MAEASANPLESVTRDIFDPAVGSTFEIRFEGGGSYTIELIAVRNVFAGGGRDDKRQPFALDFLGSAAEYVRQGSYPFEHASLGRLEFFIVPLGPDPKQGGRMRYEAIFT